MNKYTSANMNKLSTKLHLIYNLYPLSFQQAYNEKDLMKNNYTYKIRPNLKDKYIVLYKI